MGKQKKALVFAGSRGVGRSIAHNLKRIGCEVEILSSTDLDTSSILQIEKFLKRKNNYDILVLNTGGPPSKEFKRIKKNEWIKYFNQLFLSFVLILQKIKIKKNGFVFLVSSFYIKEPNEKMALSNSYRVALSSVLKIYGVENLKKNITTLNLALGPINTDRFRSLNLNKPKNFTKKYPLKKVADPDEIGRIVSMIVENDIKYLNTQTLFIDGGISKTLF